MLVTQVLVFDHPFDHFFFQNFQPLKKTMWKPTRGKQKLKKKVFGDKLKTKPQKNSFRYR